MEEYHYKALPDCTPTPTSSPCVSTTARSVPLHCQYLEDTPHSSSHSKHNGPKYCPGLTTFYISCHAIDVKGVFEQFPALLCCLMIFLTWPTESNCWPGSRLGRMEEREERGETLLYCGSGGREECRQASGQPARWPYIIM